MHLPASRATSRKVNAQDQHGVSMGRNPQPRGTPHYDSTLREDGSSSLRPMIRNAFQSAPRTIQA
jgi:hypothetical protein